MIQAKQVMEWQSQALARGREEGNLIGQIQLCQRLLNQPVSPRDDLLQNSLEDLAALAAQLENQLVPRTNGHS